MKNDIKSESPVILLWIQESPDTHETIFSDNGVLLKSGTTEYIRYFTFLTSIDLAKYKVLTPTTKRIRRKNSSGKRVSFFSGCFTETDISDRRICYRAIISGAKNEEEETCLLEKESERYHCHISEEDRLALKKKTAESLWFYFILIIVILISLWILITPKIL